MKKIPIVFAFDDNYALPAFIAIKSLLESKSINTNYDIFVIHCDINEKNIEIFNKLTKITWLSVDEAIFKNAPTSKIWSQSVYYRLLIQDLIPRYDKIIWSDVDVLFKKDLSKVYLQNIEDYYWAGVKAEYNNEDVSIHKHFKENKNEFIYMSGFMMINAKKMRDEKMSARFFDVISQYDTQLRFFDLDVLNIACEKIGEVGFEYCVLENIYDNDDIRDAPEYHWLKKVYGHDALQNAKDTPAIIHYAGNGRKIWTREFKNIPKYYLAYIKATPFYSIFTPIKRKFRKLMGVIAFSSSSRKNWRKKSKKF